MSFLQASCERGEGAVAAAGETMILKISAVIIFGNIECIPEKFR